MDDSGALVRVVAPHFVAGFVTRDGRIAEAAPILAYLVGWSDGRARLYLARKGWRASIVQGEAARPQAAVSQQAGTAGTGGVPAHGPNPHITQPAD